MLFGLNKWLRLWLNKWHWQIQRHTGVYVYCTIYGCIRWSTGARCVIQYCLIGKCQKSRASDEAIQFTRSYVYVYVRERLD